MRLNMMTDNVLHKQLNTETNIIYYPNNSLFDQILYLLDNNYFVCADTPSSSENCRCLPEEYIDLYQYDICCSNEITSYKQHTNLIYGMHLSNLLFEHHYRSASLKKEDVYILNQSLSNTKKVFFNPFTMESWNLSNSVTVNYGVPTDIFDVAKDENDVKDVLMLASNNPLRGQLYDYVTQNLNLQADIIETFGFTKIQDISNLFKKYKIFINIKNTTIDSLCAASTGMQVLALSQKNPKDERLNNVPNIQTHMDINTLIQSIDGLCKNFVINKNANEYIKNNYNFDSFNNEMQNILDTVKREAFII